MLRDVIVGEADPANVILLEIEPEKQKPELILQQQKNF